MVRRQGNHNHHSQLSARSRWPSVYTSFGIFIIALIASNREAMAWDTGEYCQCRLVHELECSGSGLNPHYRNLKCIWDSNENIVFVPGDGTPTTLDPTLLLLGVWDWEPYDGQTTPPYKSR